MRKNLPSMSSLQAFEATGRHLSFTRAAIELGVTQGAISQRIAKLEDLLCTKLFLRDGNTLHLTPIGAEFLPSARAAIIQLAHATDHAVEREQGNTLSVACLASFAIKVLIPRLRDFREAHPDLQIRLWAFAPRESPLLSGRQATLLTQDYDVHIQYGDGHWPGMVSHKLGEELFFPVCSPLLRKHRPRLRSPSDLRSQTVILSGHSITRYDFWPLWLEQAGVSDVTFAGEIYCDPIYTAIQTVSGGLGVMMGRSTLVRADLAAGLLVEPFQIRLRSPLSYHLVVPREQAMTKKVERFCQWALKSFRTNSAH